MAYHRSRSLGVGAKIIRRRKSLTSICHCSKDRSISLTLIIYPPNTQLLHSLAQFLHKFIPFFCVFHLGFGLVSLPVCQTLLETIATEPNLEFDGDNFNWQPSRYPDEANPFIHTGINPLKYLQVVPVESRA